MATKTKQQLEDEARKKRLAEAQAKVDEREQLPEKTKVPPKAKRGGVPVPTPQSGNLPKEGTILSREKDVFPTRILGGPNAGIDKGFVNAEVNRRIEASRAERLAKGEVITPEEEEVERKGFLGRVNDFFKVDPGINPETGEPNELILGTIPLGPAAASAGFLKIFAKIGAKIGKVGGGLVIGTGVGVAGQLISPFAGKRVSAPDRTIQSLDSGLSQIRETLTLPVALVTAGGDPTDALDSLADMRLLVNGAESQVKQLSIKSQELKTNPQFTFAINNRINKLNIAFDLAERQILTAQVSGEGITQEQLDELNRQVDATLK